mmetsp:Transcript_31699/g.66183  ORF Transcript_31699/g.66183 Transcript_31699/m.66183 type:complete len:95 (-) Transcript_31699:174-458(-)
MDGPDDNPSKACPRFRRVMEQASCFRPRFLVICQEENRPAGWGIWKVFMAAKHVQQEDKSFQLRDTTIELARRDKRIKVDGIYAKVLLVFQECR